MNKKKNIFLLIATAVIAWMVWLFSGLSYDNRVPANVLVVEGWMPDWALEKAYEEYVNGQYDRILVTGSNVGSHITLYVNSFLVVHPSETLINGVSCQHHYFRIEAASSLGPQDTARMVFWVNNQPTGEFLTNQQQGRFVVWWERQLPAPDSIMIQFVNDQADAHGDRNLIIRSLAIDGVRINHHTASLFLDRYVSGDLQRRDITAGSYAAMAAHFFTEKGIPADQVIPVVNEFQSIRRTYGNALALEKWLQANPTPVTGMNIVSLEYHSRRTWLTYSKVLASYATVGVVAVRNDPSGLSFRERMLKQSGEALALMYYRLFVLPWI